MIGRARRVNPLDLAVVGWYVLLTVVFLWPILVAIDSVVPHSVRDPGFQATVLFDVSTRLAHLDLSHLFDGSFYYPAHLTLAMADAQFGLQAIALPLHLAGVGPIAVVNILTILTFPVTALSADALGRYLTKSRAGGLVLGTAFAFAAFRLEHVIHLQLLQSWTIPLAFLGIEMALHEPSERRGRILWAGALVAAAATSLNYLLVLAISQPAYVGMRWLVASRRADVVAAVRRLVRPAVAAAIPIGVLVIPYFLLALQGYVRTSESTFEFSARPADYLVPAADSIAAHWLFSLHRPATGLDERELLPGVVILALCVGGLVVTLLRRDWPRLRRALPWAAIAGLAFLFSLGPYLWPNTRTAPTDLGHLISLPYRFLARPLLLSSLRSPARFGVIVLLAVAVVAAVVFVRLLARVPGRRMRAACVGFVALAMAIEYSVAIPVVTPALGANLPATYQFLRSQPEGPVVELPAKPPNQSEYMLFSTADGHPRLNGWSGFEPRVLKPILIKVTEGTLGSWLAAARRLGATYVVVHGAMIDAATLAAVHAARDAGTLVRAGTFGTDEVYTYGGAPAP